ncbi:hypothetical protein ANN_07445 [Periplaneta americana]|uniref:Uncharacterized protein n=1 Tax=Periplaneta americana TaxID=6978 RepID=A0ABQ8SZZ5_PERAM|nr:hypothetical protein ANN_07445 [Periplaneta americana]
MECVKSQVRYKLRYAVLLRQLHRQAPVVVRGKTRSIFHPGGSLKMSSTMKGRSCNLELPNGESCQYTQGVMPPAHDTCSFPDYNDEYCHVSVDIVDVALTGMYTLTATELSGSTKIDIFVVYLKTGTGGPITWPSRSPDLNPLGFYIWGHLKALVYETSRTVASRSKASRLGLALRNARWFEDTSAYPGFNQRIPNLTGPVASMTTRCNEKKEQKLLEESMLSWRL